MLKKGQRYYCETARDVDLLMSLLEKEGYKWVTGRAQEVFIKMRQLFIILRYVINLLALIHQHGVLL